MYPAAEPLANNNSRSRPNTLWIRAPCCGPSPARGPRATPTSTVVQSIVSLEDGPGWSDDIAKKFALASDARLLKLVVRIRAEGKRRGASDATHTRDRNVNHGASKVNTPSAASATRSPRPQNLCMKVNTTIYGIAGTINAVSPPKARLGDVRTAALVATPVADVTGTCSRRNHGNAR